MHMRNVDVSEKLNNLQKIFFTIRNKTNEVLKNYDDVDYFKHPTVDIIAIANDYGIKVVPAYPKDIRYEHAVLDDTDSSNIIIKVNNEDTPEEQRFSVAHELEHYFKKKAEKLKKADVFKDSETLIKANVFEKTSLLKKSNKFDDLAARTGDDYKKAAKIVKKFNGTKEIAQYVSGAVSKNLGIEVPAEKAYAELAKLFLKLGFEQIQKTTDEQFIYILTNKLYDEEIADYFAANILLPYERFTLWENKSNKTIAEAFKVPEACVAKRRKEINKETDFITYKYLRGNKG